ncbi:hypothetical protein D3C86_1732560 [compost metagenome]
MAKGTVALGVEHEVRVSVVQTKILKPHLCLLPADHSVSVVAQDDDHQIHLQTHGGFKLLAVHHETTVAAYRHNRNLGIDEACRHRRRQTGPHGCQCVIQQYGVRHVGLVVAGKPDFVDAIVQGNDAVGRHDLAQVRDQSLRVNRKTIVGGAFGHVSFIGFANRQQTFEIPGWLRN